MMIQPFVLSAILQIAYAAFLYFHVEEIIIIAY